MWLGLAAVWSVGGLVAWLVAACSQATWIATSSGLPLLAVLATATSVALRLPILSSPSRTSLRNDHAVWLLSTCASLNWLGFFVLQCPRWSDALPAVIILLVGEVWFHVTAWRCRKLPWLRAGLQSLATQLGSLGVDLSTPEANQHAFTQLTLGPDSAASNRNCQLGEQEDRLTVHGIDEQGRSYLSGELRIAFSADQPLETIVVAFSPPFARSPEVDFDCESDGVDVQLVNCTPTGMRLGIRRSTTREPLVFTLPWYAAEVESGNLSAAVTVERVLP